MEKDDTQSGENVPDSGLLFDTTIPENVLLDQIDSMLQQKRHATIDYWCVRNIPYSRRKRLASNGGSSSTRDGAEC